MHNKEVNIFVEEVFNTHNTSTWIALKKIAHSHFSNGDNITLIFSDKQKAVFRIGVPVSYSLKKENQKEIKEFLNSSDIIVLSERQYKINDEERLEIVHTRKSLIAAHLAQMESRVKEDVIKLVAKKQKEYDAAKAERDKFISEEGMSEINELLSARKKVVEIYDTPELANK